MKQKLNCILLIDDDEPTNYLSNLIIDQVDCASHVKTRQSAEAALNYLVNSGHKRPQNDTLPFPDLIFLDINMPSMNGWEFLGKYKELNSALPHIPIIIMLSTSYDPNDKKKALSIPEVSDFYTKPISPEIIYSTLVKYFPEYL